MALGAPESGETRKMDWQLIRVEYFHRRPPPTRLALSSAMMTNQF